MADAVLYNTLAWAINGSSQYATNVASWINTWFLANDTYMNPNLNYAQVTRGPTSNAGNHTGVLDLKCMVKVANAALVLRAGNAPGWTSAIDSGLVTWTKSYVEWLTTNQLGLAEAAETKCVTLMPSPRLWTRSRMPRIPCAYNLVGGTHSAAITGRTIITSSQLCKSLWMILQARARRFKSTSLPCIRIRSMRPANKYVRRPPMKTTCIS
jgi:hypothetical protein